MYKFSYETSSTENVETLTVTWSILHFKEKLDSNTNLFIRTAKADYSDDIDDDLKFKLSLRTFGSCNDLIKVYFKPPNYAFLNFVLSSKDQYGFIRRLTAMEYCGVSANKWYIMIDKPTIKLSTCDGPFIFVVTFKIRQDVVLRAELDLLETERYLNHDLENFLNNSTLFDVTLESVDGVQLPAHKNILAARSEVFKAHFEHGTTESLTNIIKSKFETEILQEVIHYIYTDCAPKLGNIAAGVLVAADYYQLTGLKFLCAKELSNKLTTENAIETLVLADLHSVSSLKDDIVKFMIDKNNQAVYESSGWKTLEDAKLLKLIHENIVKKLSTS